MSLTLRLDKGSALSYSEMDGNFTFLSSSIPNIDTNVFATTGSNTFNGNQTITGSLSQGTGTTIGDYSHAEGDNTISGIQAYYSNIILDGQIIIGGYGDVTQYFSSNNYLILDDSKYDDNYKASKLLISESYFDSPSTVINLYDLTVNAPEALIGSYYYPSLPNSDYVIGNYSHAEGSNTRAIGGGSHAEGFNTQAVGFYSHAEGYNTQAIEVSSHAEGNYTIASGSSSHAEGGITRAIGDFSHAEGLYTQAIGDSSHAEGASTQATGPYSHAEGNSTTATGNYSHAEGQSTQAVGYYSHTEGSNTQAIGNNSHAEGFYTLALGNHSHAEGSNTRAIGDFSHAEGSGSIASGSYSHAEGSSTIALGSSQHVSGKYNTHGDNTSLFIVGNGVDDNNRSDAFKIRQSGSIILPVTSSGTPNWQGTQGEMIFGRTGAGNYVIWAYLGGSWRSGSLV